MRGKINGSTIHALIDTDRSENFINASIAKANKWKIFPSSNQISMANSSLSSHVIGYCKVNLKLKRNSYQGIKLSARKNLCVAILGYNFLKQHFCVEIPFGGSNTVLNVDLAAAKVRYQSLFENLTPDCKPIAVKSRRYSQEDKQFKSTEVRKLLKGIIEPNVSPWRAQSLVIAIENHKKMMVIDYSKTINRYTLLDAYPLPRIDEIISNVAK